MKTDTDTLTAMADQHETVARGLRMAIAELNGGGIVVRGRRPLRTLSARRKLKRGGGARINTGSGAGIKKGSEVKAFLVGLLQKHSPMEAADLKTRMKEAGYNPASLAPMSRVKITKKTKDGYVLGKTGMELANA